MTRKLFTLVLLAIAFGGPLQASTHYRRVDAPCNRACTLVPPEWAIGGLTTIAVLAFALQYDSTKQDTK